MCWRPDPASLLPTLQALGLALARLALPLQWGQMDPSYLELCVRIWKSSTFGVSFLLLKHRHKKHY